MVKESELKKIRRHLGFGVKEFSELLSVNPNTYKKMESGERPLSLDVQREFENFLEERSKLPVSKLDGKIDYLRIRFKTMDYKTIIDQILKLSDKPFVQQDRGRYSYTGFVKFGEINIYYSKEDYNMGTLVEFSGQGCRLFEWYMVNEQSRDWEQFLLDCFSYASKFSETFEQIDDFIKITRIDIALDEMYSPDGNYDLSKLKRKYDLGLIKTKSESFKYVDGASGKESRGKSLYFGSKNSPVVLNFYEKDLEQADKLDVPVEFIHAEYGFKNRYEVRLLDKHAHKFVRKWLYEFDGFNLADKAVALINDKLHVYKKTSTGTKLDDEWYRLMGSYGCFKFEMVPKLYDIGVKEYRWIERSVAPTLKFLFEFEKISGIKKLWQIINDANLTEGHKQSLAYEAEMRGASADAF